MTVLTLTSGPLDTNCYLVTCLETKQTALIDAPPDCYDLVCAHIEKNQLILTKILLTHSHWDHIADVSRIKKKFNIPVFINPEDAYNLENPGADRLPSWLEIPPVDPDGELLDGSKVDIGNLHFIVIHTPGHTPGGVCFYNADKKWLFSGDTLFQGTMGKISFPSSSPTRMWASLKKLALLPAATKVFPGHGPTTTIGSESWIAHAEEMF
jgi:hydroxyacylglutathione hydrolase